MAARIRGLPKPGARAAPEHAAGYPGIRAVAGATAGVHGRHARRPQAVGGAEHARDAGLTEIGSASVSGMSVSVRVDLGGRRIVPKPNIQMDITTAST